MWCIQGCLFLLNPSFSNLEVLAEVKCQDFNLNRILFIEKQCKVDDIVSTIGGKRFFKKCMTIFSSVKSTPFPVA